MLARLSPSLLLLLMSTYPCTGWKWTAYDRFLQGASPNAKLQSVSLDDSGIWSVDSTGDSYLLWNSAGLESKTGSFVQISGLVKVRQLDAGSGMVWAVGYDGQPYVRYKITATFQSGLVSFTKVDLPESVGSIRHITVNSEGHMWAISGHGSVLRRTGINSTHPEGTRWELIPSCPMKQISAGSSGVWAVNEMGQVFYRQGTFEDPDSEGESWIRVDGSLTYVSSGDNIVAGVDESGKIFVRYGMCANHPEGVQWLQELSAVKMKMLEVFSTTEACGVGLDSKAYFLKPDSAQ